MIEASDGWTQGYALPGSYVIYKDYMDKDLKSQIIRALDKVGEGELIRVTLSPRVKLFHFVNTDDTAVMEFNPG